MPGARGLLPVLVAAVLHPRRADGANGMRGGAGQIRKNNVLNMLLLLKVLTAANALPFGDDFKDEGLASLHFIWQVFRALERIAAPSMKLGSKQQYIPYS